MDVTTEDLHVKLVSGGDRASVRRRVRYGPLKRPRVLGSVGLQETPDMLLPSTDISSNAVESKQRPCARSKTILSPSKVVQLAAKEGCSTLPIFVTVVGGKGGRSWLSACLIWLRDDTSDGFYSSFNSNSGVYCIATPTVHKGRAE